MKSITKRNSDVLRFIRRHIQERQFAPTLREIGDQFVWSSRMAASEHVRALVKAGLLTHIPYSSRTLVITAAGHQWLAIEETQPSADDIMSNESEAARLEADAVTFERHGHDTQAEECRMKARELRAKASESRQLRDPGVRFG